MSEITLHLRIRGTVQGVGYRWSMVGQARRLGLNGWVRNRADGSVEAMASGPTSTVDRLVDWARHGPPGAVVEAVDVSPGGGKFNTFDSLPTA